MKKLASYLFVLAMILISVLGFNDDKQQQEFATVRNAYENMQEGEYGEALEVLNEYKHNHSEVFWYLQEKIGEEKYRLDSIQQAIEYCEEHVTSHYIR